MQLLLKTPPATEPLTRVIAKSHMHVEDADHDDDIDGYIASARSHAETFLKCSLLPTVWTLKLDCFPRQIRFPVGPVLDEAQVTIQYVDDAGVTQTLDPADYQVSTGDTGIVCPAWSKTWPSTRQQLDAVLIDFQAGWGSVDEIPKGIIAALKLMTADFNELHENSIVGAPVSEIPTSARNLMIPHQRND